MAILDSDQNYQGALMGDGAQQVPPTPAPVKEPYKGQLTAATEIQETPVIPQEKKHPPFMGTERTGVIVPSNIPTSSTLTERPNIYPTSNSHYKSTRYGSNPYTNASTNPLVQQREIDEFEIKQQKEADALREAAKNNGTLAQVNIPSTILEQRAQKVQTDKFQGLVTQQPGMDKLFKSMQEVIDSSRNRGESPQTTEARISNMVNTYTSIPESKGSEVLLETTDPQLSATDRGYIDTALGKAATGRELDVKEREGLIAAAEHANKSYNNPYMSAVQENNRDNLKAIKGIFTPNDGFVPEPNPYMDAVQENNKSNVEAVKEGFNAVKEFFTPDENFTPNASVRPEDGASSTWRNGQISMRGINKKKETPEIKDGALTEETVITSPDKVPEVIKEEVTTSPGQVEEVTTMTPRKEPTLDEPFEEIPEVVPFGANSGALTEETLKTKEAAFTEEEMAPAGLSQKQMWGEALKNFGMAMLSGNDLGKSLAAGANGYFGAEKKSSRMAERQILKSQGFSSQVIDAYINTGDHKVLKLSNLEQARQSYAQNINLNKEYRADVREAKLYDAGTKAVGSEVYDHKAYDERKVKFGEELTNLNVPSVIQEDFNKTGDPKLVQAYLKDAAAAVRGNGGKRLTEGQTKSAVWGATANRASDQFDEHFKKYGNGFESSNIWKELIIDFASDKKLTHTQVSAWVADKFGEQAAQQMEYEMAFITPTLRQESGASIALSEWQGAGNTYFPRSRNSKELIAEKYQRRLNKVIEMKSQGNPALSDWFVKNNTKVNFVSVNGDIYALDKRTGQKYNLNQF